MVRVVRSCDDHHRMIQQDLGLLRSVTPCHRALKSVGSIAFLLPLLFPCFERFVVFSLFTTLSLPPEPSPTPQQFFLGKLKNRSFLLRPLSSQSTKND
ncbi:Uncharacterized protein TCM_027052 [Theobroma cacao]|uniref:Uncharacterized protein n=1 Tax=Theobroma cacao TaxID=3641 RepID=A0A061GF89_THECC|nr:Uncharacterized protein TCM_027052 [Theobroma cacao]